MVRKVRVSCPLDLPSWVPSFILWSLVKCQPSMSSCFWSWWRWIFEAEHALTLKQSKNISRKPLAVQCLLCVFSRVWLFATPWTVALQASLPMEFSRQEYWSGLPFASPGNLRNPGIEPLSLVSPVFGRRILYPECHLGSRMCKQQAAAATSQYTFQQIYCF